MIPVSVLYAIEFPLMVWFEPSYGPEMSIPCAPLGKGVTLSALRPIQLPSTKQEAAS